MVLKIVNLSLSLEDECPRGAPVTKPHFNSLSHSMGTLGAAPIEEDDKTLGRKSCLSQNFLSSLPILSRPLKPAFHGLFLVSAVYITTNSSSDFSQQVCLPPVL